MKKVLLLFIGLSILLGISSYVVYKSLNQSDIIDEDILLKDSKEEDKEKEEIINKDDKIMVDIKGMIKKPGVYKVDKNLRVNDVISLAGGLLEGADTSLINLAKIVKDEMTIIIYSNQEVMEKLKEDICVCSCPLIENDACIEKENNLININTSDIKVLSSVPGIGEVKAKDIIDYRNNIGKFKTIEEIKNVKGIGDAVFNKIKDFITV